MTEKARENYTRVSTILYPFSGLKDLDADMVANAARRGTKVHKICEGIVKGLGEVGVDEEALPYIESFKQWWKPETKVIEMEKRFWCDEHEITGQVDLIFEEDGVLTLLDFKTSSAPSKTWEVQGQAYYYLAGRNGFDISHIQFLHLNKHGKAPKIHSYKTYCSLFFSVYETYKHFYEGKS